MTLQLDGVSKAFDGLQAVDGVTLSFNPGRIHALIGPNGAGKTTLFNLINGFIRPDAGVILYRGERLAGAGAWRVAQQGVGRLFQDMRIFEQMTVLDNVCLGFPDQTGESSLYSVILRGKVRVEEERNTRKGMELLESVGLENRAGGLARNLSHGEQKLLALARLLAARADVLLLDEPSAGVAPHLIERLLSMIRRLADQNRTIIVIEHNMEVVTEVADLVHFMDQGRIVATGTPGEVLEDARVRAAYVGTGTLL